ncbi:MAG: hypothetical protein IKQ46_18585 [Bacteroidales bacterium]|jgi:hypothetical protein|nr:hypothetical protein [Bacteroidales bacterium]
MRLIKLLLIATVLLSSLCASAQCKQRFVYECALQNQGLIFLKEFNTKFSSGKIQKHKVILNKGYMYTLQLCNPSDTKYLDSNNSANATGLAINSMLSLYDNNNNILATTNQDFKFTFYCPKTDVYWVHIMPLSPRTTCAVGILSVMKK